MHIKFYASKWGFLSLEGGGGMELNFSVLGFFHMRALSTFTDIHMQGLFVLAPSKRKAVDKAACGWK